ncbi:RES family NAD+ phosphorylase [Pedobacter aquatilis]|uniref:RES family NAD+ phosphorylase n=1 Tax=Pedobacter aquatilis TaxID=351343 RepID=UPI0025B2AB18|nr:RES family NAD+ phosphorylase [Pedobacter aquatilis]MDN3586279.1 RES family NAD+ phosphorylase [Pedobacter aquatilis]
MILYRISNCTYAKDYSGTGAKLFGGRWNSVGVPLHYMASNRALAALEILANKNTILHSVNLCLTVFEVPGELVKQIELKDLPKNWKDYPAIPQLAKLGDAFAKQNEFLLLKVPSVLIEDEFNYLMNVNHPEVDKVKIIEVKPFMFDERLT